MNVRFAQSLVVRVGFFLALFHRLVFIWYHSRFYERSFCPSFSWTCWFSLSPVSQIGSFDIIIGFNERSFCPSFNYTCWSFRSPVSQIGFLFDIILGFYERSFCPSFSCTCWFFLAGSFNIIILFFYERSFCPSFSFRSFFHRLFLFDIILGFYERSFCPSLNCTCLFCPNSQISFNLISF